MPTKKQANATKKATKNSTTKTANKSAGKLRPACELCGKRGRVYRTECCGHLICDDEDSYVMFSYSRNSCSRNHHRYTLCGSHFNEGHPGRWQDCKVCRDGFEPEMVAWYGTNEFNFEKMENPPTFEPTLCARCKVRINLGTDGYTMKGNDYWCMRCAPMLMRSRP